MSERLNAAHGYARRGWRVIPLHNIDRDGNCTCVLWTKCKVAGKHPIHDEWQRVASSSGADVETWWTDRPDANIGIVTDRASGVWALDLDPDKGGIDSLTDLVDEYGPLPATRIHTTGSGGIHYLFSWPDFDVPTTSGNLGVGIDTRGAGNGQIVAPPSVSGRGAYTVQRDIEPQPAPDWLLDRLRDVAQRRKAGTETPVVAGEPVNVDDLPAKLRRRLSEEAKDRSAFFHGTVAACRRAGLTQGQTTTVLGHWCLFVDKYKGRVAAEVARSWGKLDDADPANDPEQPPPASQVPASDDPVRAMLDQLVALARTYQDLPDPSHLAVTLAAAASRDVHDDPVWVLLVAPPSSGKTESVRMLDLIADAHLDDVTAAGLLSWKKTSKGQAPTGVLSRVGSQALVTFGDLSTLLATSDKGQRDVVFGILRRAYDGHVVRDLGNAPEPLIWKGKLTVVGAVTGVIDNYAVHADALGPRWVYFRLPPRSSAGKRKAANLARTTQIRTIRGEAAKLTTQIVLAARGRVGRDIPEDVALAIEDAAMVTCWGRASVPRHGYGRREIDGVPIVEEPPRLIRQLRGLAIGLYSLGLSDDEVSHLCRRVALDSMPVSRRAVLEAVWRHPGATTAAVARLADVDRGVVRRNLEELELIGVVEGVRDGEEPAEFEPDRRPATWGLCGEDAELIAQVFDVYYSPVGGWTDFRVAHPHLPHEKGEQ